MHPASLFSFPYFSFFSIIGCGPVDGNHVLDFLTAGACIVNSHRSISFLFSSLRTERCWCYYCCCCRFTKLNTTPTTSSSTSITRWSISMRTKPCFSNKRRGIEKITIDFSLIFNIINIDFSFFCMNCSNKSHSFLTYRGWINCNICSHREDIPRRRLSRCSTNHGAVVFCCFSLE
jgi:hypothetical protein